MKGGRSFIVLILAAAVLCSLVGTTGAYFTDTKTTPGINISTGYWVEPPHICSVIPGIGISGCGVHLVVLGGGFAKGAQVELIRGEATIQAGDVKVACSRCIYCRLDLAGASPGLWDVRVTNPDGGSAVLEKGFLVIGCGGLKTLEEPQVSEPPGVPAPCTEPPSKDPGKPTTEEDNAVEPPQQEKPMRLDFRPRSARVGEVVDYVITGYAFVPGIVVILRRGEGQVMSLNGEVRGQGFEGRLYLEGVWPGVWEITLKFPDGTLLPIEGGFTVYK